MRQKGLQLPVDLQASLDAYRTPNPVRDLLHRRDEHARLDLGGNGNSRLLL
jgi:hypothetical protein